MRAYLATLVCLCHPCSHRHCSFQETVCCPKLTSVLNCMHFMRACNSQCFCQASSLITHPGMSALAAGNDLEESGWKMVSGDVFRPPKNAIHLCVQIGSGVQIITSAFATLFFAALGECPPAMPPLTSAQYRWLVALCLVTICISSAQS